MSKTLLLKKLKALKAQGHAIPVGCTQVDIYGPAMFVDYERIDNGVGHYWLNNPGNWVPYRGVRPNDTPLSLLSASELARLEG
jgi:hypothetical protein